MAPPCAAKLNSFCVLITLRGGLIVFHIVVAIFYGSVTSASAASLLLFASRPAFAALNGSLADVKHVVLFMQENQAFDQYFCTLAGVRGFNNPNVPLNDNESVWYQEVNSIFSNDTTYLLPMVSKCSRG